MSKRNKEMASLGGELRKYISRLDKSGKLKEARAIECWDSVVGPSIAKHTFGTTLRNGELTVSVDSAAWAAELTAMSEHLRMRLNEALGTETVKSMRFPVSRRVREESERIARETDSGRRYGGRRVEPKPLTPQELEAILRSVEVIDDPDVREAAYRATVKDQEWKKGLASPSGPQGADGGSQDTDSRP